MCISNEFCRYESTTKSKVHIAKGKKYVARLVLFVQVRHQKEKKHDARLALSVQVCHQRLKKPLHA